MNGTGTSATLIERVCALVGAGDRPDAADLLAQHLRAESLLVFVPDSELGVWVPAPRLAQTLRGGPAWRAFLARFSGSGGRVAAVVDMPLDQKRPAVAMMHPGVVAVLLGGAPREADLEALDQMLPLLAAAFGAEHRVASARAEAAAAREAASSAVALTQALERARAEHARLNADLREEQRRKDEFLAMLAHELRNPLAPLLMSLEVLRHPAANPSARERQFGIMRRQIAQLTRLVDDLLDVSRVSRGRIKLQRQRLTLRSVLENAVEATQPAVQARRHTLELTLPEAELMVDVDAARMSQVFANLIHNAAKYTDPGGRLRVVARLEDGCPIVQVIDNGIGIEAAMLPRVFDVFVQAAVSIERSQGGLGIGLTLVRQLVELHGGRVDAESDGRGQGSCFTVRLPRDEPVLEPAATPALADVPAHTATTTAGRTMSRVLVVDDNRDAADSLAELAELLGHEARTAYSGTSALRVVDEFDPDLVLLDIGLPELDGCEVARRLRLTARPQLRIVAVSGYSREVDRRSTAEAGFDDHLVKPVSPEALATALLHKPGADADDPAAWR